MKVVNHQNRLLIVTAVLISVLVLGSLIIDLLFLTKIPTQEEQLATLVDIATQQSDEIDNLASRLSTLTDLNNDLTNLIVEHKNQLDAVSTELARQDLHTNSLSTDIMNLNSQISVLQTESAQNAAEMIAMADQIKSLASRLPTLTPLPQTEAQSNSVSLSMLVSRNLHTATLLPDGTVLFIGGNTAPGIDTNTTELFDPTSNTFSFSSPLNTPRHDHTSTLLQDGRILVIGGYGAGSWLNDAEIFDPQNSQWQYSQPLFPHGVVHTATSLPDGRIFVLGGAFRSGTSGQDDRAEVFDPLTNLWYNAAYHEGTEANHTATLLMDGRILIAAGLVDPTIYNPATDRWSPAGSLHIPRAGAKAVLLKDGRVLLVGGFSPPSTGNFVTPSAEIYDPSNNSWRLTASMNQARYLHTATLLPDGRVVVIGGWNMINGYENALSSLVEIFDPSQETWTVLPSPQIGRVTHTATLLNDGRILVVGGEARRQEYLNSVLLFNP